MASIAGSHVDSTTTPATPKLDVATVQLGNTTARHAHVSYMCLMQCKCIGAGMQTPPHPGVHPKI